MLRECGNAFDYHRQRTKEDIAEVDHALVEVLNGATSSYSEYLSYSLIDIKETRL